MKHARPTLIAAMAACLLPGPGGAGEHAVAAAQFVFVPAPVTGPTAPPGVTRATATVQTTDRIVREISAARDFCGRLAQKEYVIDCLADQLATVADNIPLRGDYREARRTIDAAARDLRALARGNADPALPRARLRTPTLRSSRAITPVRSDALSALNDRAAGILQEAETTLLRSAENSERRMVHYQRIADAVGSTKVLLRSL
ncbi:hypothetical protein Ga0609869_002487 [Rhodovulum iodosum]|uniref:Uncharacterized protein n=1 Tax=Rhodovulum iodosum TaxID=68291 RepID=A0ABV3XUX0_9RHOB|nr:hypothetical protein [Rhodovulum robiginosum]RSK40786.1 hypothetical protein EJA01_00500 [Rhodovulum robiginosum]